LLRVPVEWGSVVSVEPSGAVGRVEAVD